MYGENSPRHVRHFPLTLALSEKMMQLFHKKYPDLPRKTGCVRCIYLTHYPGFTGNFLIYLVYRESLVLIKFMLFCCNDLIHRVIGFYYHSRFCIDPICSGNFAPRCDRRISMGPIYNLGEINLCNAFIIVLSKVPAATDICFIPRSS